MWFTEAEAKAQAGKWVRVRDDSLWIERIDKGARGKVVHAQRYQEDGWSVGIEFYLSPDQSLSVLLRDVDKEQYAGLCGDLSAELSSETAGNFEYFQSHQNYLPAPKKTLTLVFSSGLMKK